LTAKGGAARIRKCEDAGQKPARNSSLNRIPVIVNILSELGGFGQSST
jgi:hypothetical protein